MVQNTIKNQIDTALSYPNGLIFIEDKKPNFVQALSKEGYDLVLANEKIDRIIRLKLSYQEAVDNKELKTDLELNRHITERMNYVRPVLNDLSLETVWR